MNGNDFVKLALRSPLYVIMGDTMLITVTGRKTGRKTTLPVNFYGDGRNLWIISSRSRTGWRNLIRGAEIALRLHGQDLKGFGEAILHEKAVAAQMREYVRRLPSAARHTGLRVWDGVPDCEDLARLGRSASSSEHVWILESKMILCILACASIPPFLPEAS